MTRPWLLIAALGLLACHQAVTFQGEHTLAIQGTPPPPAPEAKAPPRVELRDNKIAIHEKIQFDYDKATIKETSAGLMAEIADVIKKNPQIKKLQIEGYASAEGDAQHNQALSTSRAQAVMAYLARLGVSGTQLAAVGHGEANPVADNSTDAGREANRRVEFTILEQEVTQRRVEIDPATGTEKVVGETHQTVTTPDSAQPGPGAMTTSTKKGG
jgi:outer membrane protein OmpA-like peptidoglycan-associated protein